MTSEITYAEVRFKNEFKSSGINTASSAGKDHFLGVRVNDEVKDEERVYE